MKTKEQFWLYWWWVYNARWPGNAFIKSTFSSRRLTAKYIQQYDRDNGCKVGKVHRLRVGMDKLT